MNLLCQTLRLEDGQIKELLSVIKDIPILPVEHGTIELVTDEDYPEVRDYDDGWKIAIQLI